MESHNRESTATSGGIGGEIKSLQRHGTATMAEVREFIGQMRGKGPREMLGALAESGLLRATIQATIGCVILMALFTAGPYLLGGGKADAKRGAARPSATSTDDAPNNATAANPDSSAANVAADATAGGKATKGGPLENPPIPVDIEQAAKKLGVGETKHADPKVNPLDKALDNLLDKAK